MNPSAAGRGALTTTELSCGSCGSELPPDSRFSNKCGAAVRPAATSAEYKQVTVLLASVVHSVVRDVWLRALLSHAYGDEAASRDYRDMARTLGIEGHIAS